MDLPGSPTSQTGLGKADILSVHQWKYCVVSRLQEEGQQC